MNPGELKKALSQFGIDESNFRVIGLLPLVYVAWADGTIQTAERRLIEKAGRQKGWLNDASQPVLDAWLSTPPSKTEFETGMQLLRGLIDQQRGLGSSMSAQQLPDLIDLCADVSESAGGMFGMRDAICDDERVALTDVARALLLDTAEPVWDELSRDESDGSDESRAPGPPAKPVVGHILDMAPNSIKFLLDARREYGDLVRLKIGPKTAHLVSNPQHVKHVLADNNRNYQRDWNYKQLSRLLGTSIITMDGDEWKKRRRIVQRAFSRSRIEDLVPSLAGHTDGFGSEWQDRPEAELAVDIQAEMTGLALRLIVATMFSRDISKDSAELGQVVAKAVHHLAESSNNPLRIPDFVPTRKNLDYKDSVSRLDNLIYAMIDEREQTDEDDRPNDLLSMLMAATDDETGEKLSRQALRDEAMTAFVAGHDTTAGELAWCWYYLSRYPGVQRRLRDEIVSSEADLSTASGLASLRYLDCFIKEVLRLRPSVWAFTREAVAEDYLDTYKIPAGSLLLVSQLITHRDSRLWTNPEGFDPDRFLPENESSIANHTYYPFGGGARKCIGAHLATLEIRLVLARLLPRFAVDLVPGAEAVVKPAVTLTAGHLPMTIRPL